MSGLRAITDAEAHPWPRPCRVCGASVTAAAWTEHTGGHLIAGFRGLAAEARTATHSMLALGDAMERYVTVRRAGPQPATERSVE